MYDDSLKLIVSASEPFPTMNHSSFISELTRTDKDVRNQTITADEPPCKLILISGYGHISYEQSSRGVYEVNF